MEKNITALFEINVPKPAKNLTKFVGKDETRPVFKYVCIEPGRGLMVASDTHVLRTEKIVCSGEWPEGLQVLADPKHIAKIAGKTALIKVSEEEREVTEMQTVYRNGRQCCEPVKVNRVVKVVRIECEGETYITEGKFPRFPDIARVIPKIDQMKQIRLNVDNLAALKTICKLATNETYITLSAKRGSNRLIVADVNEGYNRNASYSLEMAEGAELDITIGLNPAWLANCLTGSNGVIRVIEDCRPVYFEGNSEHTICMPVMTSQSDRDYIEQIRTNRVLSFGSFSYDLAEVMKQLRNEAAALWEDIKSLNNKGNLIPGNYSAKDIANRYKAKCGNYFMPEREEENINISFGNISFEFHHSELFSMFAIWESATRSKKMLFAAGNVEETTETVMITSESGAAEKKMKLRKLGGNWYCNAKRGVNDWNVMVYYQLNGVIFKVDTVGWNIIDDPEKWAEWVEKHEGRLIDALSKTAENNPYYAEICRLTGIKAKAEKEAQQPATEAETPQISTESAETKQVSAEEEKSGETANYRISRHSHDDYAKIIVGDRSQSKVIAILLTIDNKSYIEINDEPAGLATIGQRPLQTAKPITELTDTEILKLIYNSPQPPTEPPQNTETDERQDIPPKPKELVRIVSAAPPGPPKTIHSASGPPGFKFIITQPTINKKLKLQNHDRHNNLAPPYLHSRMLRLSRLSGGSGYDLRNLCARNPLIMPLC